MLRTTRNRPYATDKNSLEQERLDASDKKQTKRKTIRMLKRNYQPH